MPYRTALRADWQKLLYAFFLLISVCPAFAQTNVQTYEQLVKTLREIRDEQPNLGGYRGGEENIREAWQMGDLIRAHVRNNREDAKYMHQLLENLTRDLGMKHSDLYYRVEFAKDYPSGRPQGSLTWTHYQMLLGVDDPREREELAKEAAAKTWDALQLREEISKRNRAKREIFETAAKEGTLPEMLPGPLHVYRIVRVETGPYEGKLAVDLGLSNLFLPEETGSFKEGDRVIDENRNLKIYEGPGVPGETYNAAVTQVVDGDTFFAQLDLGFKVLTEQKMRLARIDAPEFETSEGQAARKFLADMFDRSGGKIVVQSRVRDKYNRYLADVWVDGEYVNREMIAHGHAILIQEE